MKYKHLKYKANIWLKLMFLNYTITTSLAIFSFDIIKAKTDPQFLTNWYAILVMVLCVANILHFIITSIVLCIKQFRHDNKEISQSNSIAYNELLFKIVKVENIINFCLINFLNIVIIIFLVKTFNNPNPQFSLHIFLVIINILFTNTLIFRFWYKTK